MKKTNNSDLEEEMPEHIQKIQQKLTGNTENAEIDWEFWHFVAIYIFRFSESEFFNDTTLRRLFNLVNQYEKFHENN